ncbi:hypothetical protein CAC42_2863 [Sphaceloma murrayae]|uniref:Nucleolar 27S pre-rRNA processing Urb2/Npa2 C-terminal domain-containing protein n=1 Tax=Sphaceloma murrayae TaxID=2082308 RepID=A0A2K1R0V4_9PEZI|nr:hypothetical protein CAC42_2863 [Sphaceloma murrayae]
MGGRKEPSLQRLLALDKTFDGLDDRITEASRILSISLKEDVTVDASPACRNYGRQDWTFRWILSHLKKDKKTRCNVLAWRLVRQLVASVPGTICAKWISSAGLFNILSDTLEEVAGNALSNNSSKLLTSGSPNDANDKPSAKAVSDPKTKRMSRKRKRDTDSGHSKANPENTVLVLYQEIIGLFRDLTTTGDAQGGRRVVHSQIVKPFLAVMETDAGTFLRRWALATTYVVAMGDDSTAFFIDEVCQHMRRTWRRKRQAYDGQLWRKALSTEALWPLLVLWTILSDQAPFSKVRDGQSYGRALRALIVEEILLPTRDLMTIAASTGAIKDSLSGIAEDHLHAIFNGVIDGAIDTLKSTPNHSSDGLKTICASCRLLIHAAVDLVDATTLMQKRIQLQWFGFIFEQMSKLGSKVGSEDVENAGEVAHAVTTALLGPLKGRKGVLSVAVLKDLLSTYSGLQDRQDGESEAAPDFVVISQIISIDESVFEIDPSTAETSVGVLMDAMTRYASTAESQQLDDLVAGVILPLLSGQRRSRKAAEFLQMALQTVRNDPSETSPLWRHDRTKLELAKLVETSVATTDIQTLLQSVQVTLTTDSKATKEDALIADLSALDVLIQTLRSESTIEALQADLTNLLRDMNFTVKQNIMRDQLGRRPTFCWSILSSLNERLASSVGDSSQKLVGLQSDCMEIAEETLKKSTDRLLENETEYMISYLFQAHELLVDSVAEQESLVAFSDRFVTKALVERYPVPLARALVTHPATWTSLNAERQEGLLELLVVAVNLIGCKDVFLDLWGALVASKGTFDWARFIEGLLEHDIAPEDLTLAILSDRWPSHHFGHDEKIYTKTTQFLLDKYFVGESVDQRLSPELITDRAKASRILVVMKQHVQLGSSSKDPSTVVAVQHARTVLEQNFANISVAMDHDVRSASTEATAVRAISIVKELTTTVDGAAKRVSLLKELSNILELETDPKALDGLLHHLRAAFSITSAESLIQSIHQILEQPGGGIEAGQMMLVHEALQSLQKPDNLHDEFKMKGHECLILLANKLQAAPSTQICLASLRTLTLCLKEKRFLTNQYVIESILQALVNLSNSTCSVRTRTTSSSLYLELCSTTQVILQFHRSSLGGRLHLVIPLLNQLLSCSFIPHIGSRTRHIFHHPSWLQASQPLRSKHAVRFTRLVTLLCNPPQSTISGYRARSNKPGLVDDLREARMHVSEFVGLIVHSFCRFMLNGTLADGVKDALNPALYAVFDVMDMAAPEDERVKALGATMTKPELALLRKEHGEWKRFGRWAGA